MKHYHDLLAGAERAENLARSCAYEADTGNPKHVDYLRAEEARHLARADWYRSQAAHFQNHANKEAA